MNKPISVAITICFSYHLWFSSCCVHSIQLKRFIYQAECGSCLQNLLWRGGSNTPLFELPDFFVRSAIRDRCSYQFLSHKPESVDKLYIHNYRLTIQFSYSVQHVCGLLTRNERKILVWGPVLPPTAFRRLNFISLEQKHVKEFHAGQFSRINFIPILESIFYSACFAYYFQSF